MARSSPLRSTVFRLTLVAVAALGLAAAAVVVLVGSDANRVLTRATEEAIGLDAAHFKAELLAGGPEALAQAVAERSRNAAGGLYFLGDGAGRKHAGNLPEPPREIQGGLRGGIFRYHLPERTDPGAPTAAGLVIDIDAGAILVVARDVEGQRGLVQSLYRNLGLGLGALTLLGVAGGFLLARYILGRIDSLSRASEAIIAGNLAGRLPRAGSGDELDRLADQLNAMLERIERLMGGLREVSDNIAHDLKTPLNRLRNSAEAALADQRGGPAWREGLERTIEEADALIKTFNALLLIARLEAGAIEESFEPLDLAQAVRDVAELYEPVADEHGFHIDVAAATSAPIRANRQLVGQAIANLIDNAIKYARRTGGDRDTEPAIAISVAVRDGHAVLIVADHGPGIPAADRERVLKRFVRLEASRTRPGTGLGLSLVAAVAVLHRGALRLEDNAPGLRVVLTLPLASPAPFVPKSMPAVAASIEKV